MTVNRTKLAVLVALVACLVGACSSRSGEPQSAQRQDAKTAPTSSVESAPQATVEDFARVIAEREGEWDERVADLDSLCLDPQQVALCHMTYFTLSMQAETIGLALSTVHKPTAPGYVGEAPAEIEDLLSETESAASAAADASNALVEDSGCDDPFADTCIEQKFAADSAIEDLSSKIDAWALYS